MTDDRIAELVASPKRAISGAIKWEARPGHRVATLTLHSELGEFKLFLRQNDSDPSDFSVGLTHAEMNGASLLRCNGDHGDHTNRQDGSVLDGGPHIHKATAWALANSRAADNWATATTAYTDWPGALSELCRMANITGVDLPSPALFPES